MFISLQVFNNLNKKTINYCIEIKYIKNKTFSEIKNLNNSVLIYNFVRLFFSDKTIFFLI